MEEVNKDNLKDEEVLNNQEASQEELNENWQQEEILEDKEFEEIENEDAEEDNIKKPKKELKRLQKENNKLQEQNAKLQEETNVLKDRLLRVSAEYDNYRRRTVKEKEGIYSDAVTDVLKNILPVLDNLERASSTEGSVDDIKKGIDLTLKQFQNALEKLGVEEISIAEGFDPNYHEAVMHIEDESYEKNSVAEVFQKGYKKGSKVIRHSIVKVAN
ncbi:nucleotide exchange factor GrpE [Alloiococcus sp. CFN-8]|uniref:nucleotide exchange factor GrpE n=1 Tax=Alloiococcus sp. CFN-8 TaxID=3416081 RepID=UPI003CF7B25D